MRGAQVRDALAWSHQIGEALQRFGGDTDILVAQHHWPTWGRERIQSLLRKQRDAYKFVHDQSVRLMNLGVPADEAAERIQLPTSLAAEASTQPFYGHLKHNVRAVYQRYLGYYDGNPVPLAALQSGAVRIDGNPLQVAALFGMLDNFDRVFPLVEPVDPVR